jgi:hypothetical protein
MVAPSWGSFQKPNDQISKLDRRANIEPKEETNGAIADEKKPEGEKPQWGNFQSPSTYQGKIDPTAEESTIGYFARNIAANASRVGEQLLGRYGNVEKFAKKALTSLPESTGVIGWALSELVGKEKWERLINGPKGQEQMLPTSEQLKEGSQALTGGYTKPKTPGESRFQEKTEDIASTITGRTVNNPTIRNVALNNLLTPVAAGVTKDIVKDLGFGEDKANLAKIAVWLPLSLASNVNANQYASDLMNRGRQGFNPNLQVNTPRYQAEVDRVSRNMLQGDPGSALAQQQIAGIRNDLANGQTSIRDLLTRYDALNRAKRDRGLFALNATDRRAAIRNINEVRDVVRGEIQHLGANNPQALRDWQNGVQAWATIHQSNSIRNWVESLANGPYAKVISGPALGLFGIGSLAAAKAPIIAGPVSAVSAGAYKSGQTLYRMWNDPNLNQYYWNAIGAAQRENIPAFLSNYEKLNKKLEESSTRKPESKSKK